MNYCPTCGASVAGQRFCSQCGTALTPDPAHGSAGPAGSSGAERGFAPSPGDTQELPEVTSGYGSEDETWIAGPAGQPYRQPGSAYQPAGYETPAYEPPAAAYPPEHEREAQRSRAAVILIAVGMAVVAAVVFATWQLTRSGDRPTPVAAETSTSSPAPTPSPSDTPTRATTTTLTPASPPKPTITRTPASPATPKIGPAARKAAREIDNLLSQSAGQRSLVVSSVTCQADPDRAVDNLSEALFGRARLTAQVDQAPFDQLPQGARMRAELRKAWELSKYADQNFLEWATTWRDTGECRTRGVAYDAAVGQSETAQRHKRAFAQLWEKNVRLPMNLATKRTPANI